MEYSSLSSDLDTNLILFLTLCVGLCGPFTGGESWVNFSLSFCSPFSLFPSLTAPKSGKTKQNTMLLCVLLSVITYVCLENYFFFMSDCSQQWAYSFVLLTDTGDLESMKAEAQA